LAISERTEVVRTGRLEQGAPGVAVIAAGLTRGRTGARAELGWCLGLQGDGRLALATRDRVPLGFRFVTRIEAVADIQARDARRVDRIFRFACLHHDVAIFDALGGRELVLLDRVVDL